MEDANDAIAMIFEGGQYWLLGWCIVFILSVAIMNYAGKYIFSIYQNGAHSININVCSILKNIQS